jgi:hypothetical protein
MLFELKYYNSDCFSLLERIDIKLDNGIEGDPILKFVVIVTTIVIMVFSVYNLVYNLAH